MLRTGLAVFLLSLVTALVAFCQDQSLPQPGEEPIRTTVNVVLAPVTVLDKHGNLVNGLQPQDFRLLDNNKEQNIKVDVAFQPISMVIAIQANSQVEGVLPKINRIGSLIEPLVYASE